MTEQAETARLLCRGISKRFHGVTALSDVDFDLWPGEAHGLVGENGAGKSTRIKILTGVYRPDGGTMTLDGAAIDFRSPHEAQAAGIACTYQEMNLVPTLGAAENIFAGVEPVNRWGLVDWRRMRDDAAALLDRYHIKVDLRRPLGELGLAAQQMVAIVRSLSQGGRILVLDEPTSALTHREVDLLMATAAQIVATGVSVIYISHRLDELFRLTQRVTVLRDGRRVLTERTTALTRTHLVQAMLGHAGDRRPDNERSPPAERPLRGSLGVKGLARPPVIASADLDVPAGQIVGLAGLQGSGRSEIMRLIFGADAKSGGSVTMDSVALRAPSPAASLARGLALLPEDRKADGIIPELSLRENLTLILLPKLSRLGLIALGRERKLVEAFIRRLGVRAASAEIPIRDLSGGNQQKVLIARLLCTDPRYLLLDDPMRGIDVGAKAEIERLIVELASEGLGVLMTSSELEEVLGISDTVVVVRDGATEGTLPKDQADFAAVAAAIAESGPREQAA